MHTHVHEFLCGFLIFTVFTKRNNCQHTYVFVHLLLNKSFVLFIFYKTILWTIQNRSPSKTIRSFISSLIKLKHNTQEGIK